PTPPRILREKSAIVSPSPTTVPIGWGASASATAIDAVSSSVGSITRSSPRVVIARRTMVQALFGAEVPSVSPVTRAVIWKDGDSRQEANDPAGPLYVENRPGSGTVPTKDRYVA